MSEHEPMNPELSHEETIRAISQMTNVREADVRLFFKRTLQIKTEKFWIVHPFEADNTFVIQSADGQFEYRLTTGSARVFDAATKAMVPQTTLQLVERIVSSAEKNPFSAPSTPSFSGHLPPNKRKK